MVARLNTVWKLLNRADFHPRCGGGKVLGTHQTRQLPSSDFHLAVLSFFELERGSPNDSEDSECSNQIAMTIVYTLGVSPRNSDISLASASYRLPFS